MFIKEVRVQNFRLFSADRQFSTNKINIPDSKNDGSGLTVFVGENGCGKTALLDAIALPLLSYKADSFSFHDLNDPDSKVHIEVQAEKNFTVDGTMPRNPFQSKGFSFEAGVRSRKVKAFLSSVVVSDQKYIKADGQEKPKDGSPDLRVGVNNPFKGIRFSENDILFLDKNRVFNTRSGTYNSTRFDRLMGDFNYQYIKGTENGEDISGSLDDIKRSVENEFLENAISEFKEISGSQIALNFLDNWQPFDRCFFAEKKDNFQQIPLNRLGSGYEMIFALLYSFHLTQQSGKQLVILLDEPELHLHPSLQGRFVQVLLEFAKVAQIILTTHSPLLVKQLFSNSRVTANVLKRTDGEVQVLSVEERVLPYISANEINYLAFELATEEHHNELYEELKFLNGDDKGIKQFDKEYFQSEKHADGCFHWMNHSNEVSIHTFVRNQIHHQKEYGKAEVENLKTSIEFMRGCLREMVTSDE